MKMQTITTFLMFDGKAEQAMNLYVSLFADSEIKSISRYEENEEGPVSAVRHAVFLLNGQSFMCIDSAVKHGFTFTPAMSLHVTCAAESEIDRLYAALSQGGQVHMPLDAYPFSKKYAWLSDQYSVSWPLMLADT